MNSRGLLEAILFVLGDPVEVSKLAVWTGLPEDRVLELAEQQPEGTGLLIRRYDDRLQLATAPEYAERIREILEADRGERLSRTLLETLSIVAYRQPITRQEVDDIRGVHSAYALAALQERGLIHRTGTKDVLGHPALYGTTEAFLRQFDLTSLRDLPPLPEAGGQDDTRSSREDKR